MEITWHILALTFIVGSVAGSALERSGIWQRVTQTTLAATLYGITQIERGWLLIRAFATHAWDFRATDHVCKELPPDGLTFWYTDQGVLGGGEPESEEDLGQDKEKDMPVSYELVDDEPSGETNLEEEKGEEEEKKDPAAYKHSERVVHQSPDMLPEMAAKAGPNRSHSKEIVREIGFAAVASAASCSNSGEKKEDAKEEKLEDAKEEKLEDAKEENLEDAKEKEKEKG